MDTALFIAEFYPFFLVACRIIGMASFMPFLSSSEISPRFRLMAALGFAFLITPSIGIKVETSIDILSLGTLILRELAIGSFIGLVGKMLMAILDITGSLISSYVGLSSATTMNPNMQGSSLTSTLLVMFGTALFLSLDLHHLMFVAFVKSYSLMPLQGKLLTADMSSSFIQLLSRVFWMGIQLSLPFLIVFMIMQIAYGLMNRMIPQMQIFFVSLPFQLWSGLVIFLIVSGAMLVSFGHTFEDEFRNFFSI